MPVPSEQEVARSNDLRTRVEGILSSEGVTRRQLADELVHIAGVIGIEQWGSAGARSDPVELADMALKQLLESKSLLTKNLDRLDATLNYRDEQRASRSLEAVPKVTLRLPPTRSLIEEVERLASLVMESIDSRVDAMPVDAMPSARAEYVRVLVQRLRVETDGDEMHLIADRIERALGISS